MYTRRIRFDRVFDVRVRTLMSGTTYTDFAFEADGRTVRGARIKGKVDIPQGAELTIALPRENGWAALLGWVDHSTGRMVCDTPRPYAVVAVVCGFLMASQFALTWIVVHSSHRSHDGSLWMLGQMCVFMALVFAASIWYARLKRQAYRFLSATLAAHGAAA